MLGGVIARIMFSTVVINMNNTRNDSSSSLVLRKMAHGHLGGQSLFSFTEACIVLVAYFKPFFRSSLPMWLSLLIHLNISPVDANDINPVLCGHHITFSHPSFSPMSPSGIFECIRTDVASNENKRLRRVNDFLNIRGGGGSSNESSSNHLIAKSSKKKTYKGASKSRNILTMADDEIYTQILSMEQNSQITQPETQYEIGGKDINMSTASSSIPNLRVKAILLPRQTSFLTPLRFLSFLLMNMSMNYCVQTSGKPLEDAVRRILGMPSPENARIIGDESNINRELERNFASKVTPIHVYIAKKIISSSSSSSYAVELLPPAHLPSPLPLLGLFLSLILYLGGAVFLPRWSVVIHVFLNYLRFDIHDNDVINTVGICDELQNWFDKDESNNADPYYESLIRKPSRPAVLVYEVDSEIRMEKSSERAVNRKATVCPLFRSPGYENDASGLKSDSEHEHYRHPRIYYFELDQKRYYYDPMYHVNENSHLPPLVSGGPSLHEATTKTLLSNHCIRGLHTSSQLMYAKSRYSTYSHISIPVPTLTSAFVQRITSPLVALQLVGRLLSLVEEESLGRSLASLLRLSVQHLVDAKRSIAAAITLAEEVRVNEAFGDSGCGYVFWAVRPKMIDATEITEETAGKAGEKNRVKKETSEWVQVSPTELLPGDVFFFTPMARPGANYYSTSDLSKGKVSYSRSPLTVPVDALLLEGTCVTEEAALTGESVPQAKVPLDLALDESQDHGATQQLDMSGYHRSSCVFAGTKILHSANYDECTNSDATSHQFLSLSSSITSTLPPLPKEISTKESFPALFLTLRTGSYSSRGEIMQSLLKNRKNVGALTNRGNEMDSIRLIAVLSIFAVGACAFLFVGDPVDRRQDTVFKRIIQVRSHAEGKRFLCRYSSSDEFHSLCCLLLFMLNHSAPELWLHRFLLIYQLLFRPLLVHALPYCEMNLTQYAPKQDHCWNLPKLTLLCLTKLGL